MPISVDEGFMMSGVIHNNVYQTMAVPLKAAPGAPSELKLAIMPESLQPADNDIFQSTAASAPAAASSAAPATAPAPAATSPTVSAQSLAQTASDSSISAGAAGTSGLALILLGIPDGAKKALADKIASSYNVPHISVGRLVSAEIASGSQLGKAMQQARDAGETPSGCQVGDLIARRLEQDDCKNGFVLDAFTEDLVGSALHKLTSANDNVKAIALDSLQGGKVDDVPALSVLKQRGDLFNAPDTGDSKADGAYLDAIAANFVAPEKQEMGLFR
jgi:hypothetical protein